MIAFGFGPNLVKLAADYSAYKVAAARTVFAFLILIPVWMVHIRDEKKKGGYSFSLSPLEVIAGLSLGIHFVTWIASLYYTSVASASVLVTFHPILMILAERLLFKVKFRAMVWAGVMVSFTGSALLGLLDQQPGETYPNPLLGNALAFSAAIIFAVYFLISRKVRQGSAWIDYVIRIYGFAALACIAVLLFLDNDFSDILDPKLLLIGLLLALGPQLMGHGSINYAVKFISPTIISTLILVEPLIASVIAVILFAEIPGPYAIAAMLIIFVGIALTWSRKKTASA
jgi:drug/metabolite transporter (DMT)-like permease